VFWRPCHSKKRPSGYFFCVHACSRSQTRKHWAPSTESVVVHRTRVVWHPRCREPQDATVEYWAGVVAKSLKGDDQVTIQAINKHIKIRKWVPMQSSMDFGLKMGTNAISLRKRITHGKIALGQKWKLIYIHKIICFLPFASDNW
jgi:hypothetical protein